MSREIKFRVWDTNMNRMYSMKQLLLRWNTLSSLTCPYFKTMQFTGIKDKNDKEIYEGDIVQYKTIRAKVIYGFCGFEFEWIDGKTDIVRQRKTEEMFGNTSLIFEVIGNIYENEELLKGVKAHD